MKRTARDTARTVAPKHGNATGAGRRTGKGKPRTVAALCPAFAALPKDSAATLAELARLAADARAALARLAEFVHDSCDTSLMMLAPEDATAIFALAGYVAQRTARAFAYNARTICKAIAGTRKA